MKKVKADEVQETLATIELNIVCVISSLKM
jgi:hypothetical protein